jgi:uncharacterized membrane protein YeaQ/YmgE (transglycosylase-associated protein family)
MNLGDKAKQILATLAPMLGTAIGGPFGALAGAALSQALGTPPDDQKATEAALLSANPETLLKVKEAEEAFSIRMRELGISEQQLVFTDIADARKMQTAVRDPTVPRLAWLVIGGFILISAVELVAMMVWPERVTALPQAAWLLIGSLLGFLANEAKQAGAFYFGSSAGSKDKDETISEIAKQP